MFTMLLPCAEVVVFVLRIHVPVNTVGRALFVGGGAKFGEVSCKCSSGPPKVGNSKKLLGRRGAGG